MTHWPDWADDRRAPTLRDALYSNPKQQPICPACEGRGRYDVINHGFGDTVPVTTKERCDECHGRGTLDAMDEARWKYEHGEGELDDYIEAAFQQGKLAGRLMPGRVDQHVREGVVATLTQHLLDILGFEEGAPEYGPAHHAITDAFDVALNDALNRS